MKKFQITKEELIDWRPRIEIAYSGGVTMWAEVDVVSKSIRYVVTERSKGEVSFDDIQNAIDNFNSRMK